LTDIILAVLRIIVSGITVNYRFIKNSLVDSKENQAD
jgi:hypothetical protein